MRAVHQIDSFQDIEKAFSPVRTEGDNTPVIEERARLIISMDSLSLTGSTRFVLSDELKKRGIEFVEHCISSLVGSRKYTLANSTRNLLKEEDDD